MATYSCTNCQDPVERQPSQAKGNVFCSRSCSASFNNRKSPKRQLEGNCGICEKPIPASLSYCSDVCREIARPKTSQEERRARSKRAVVEWRRRTKERAVEYKGGSCQECGYDRSVAAMQFHHRDPSQKDFSIAASGNCRAWSKIATELDKCDLLCGNCHAEHHEVPDPNIPDHLCQYRNCQKPLAVLTGRGRRRKFCSQSCKRLYYPYKRRRVVKERMVAHMGGGCQHCGYDKSIVALHSHHLRDKDFPLSKAAHKAWSVVEVELEKCVLLCSNCHAEEHERGRI